MAKHEHRTPVLAAHSSADPLADWTPKEVFVECAWTCDESTANKIFLLCVAAELDENLQSAETSYSRISRRTGLHESTTKKIARQVTGNDPKGEHRVWLNVKVGGGFYVEGKGFTNLYTGMAPLDLVEQVRANVSAEAGSPQNTPAKAMSGVASEYPESDRGHPGIPRNAKSGVAQEYSGSPQTTHTLSLKEKEESALATPSPPSSGIKSRSRAPSPSKEEAGAQKETATPTNHFNGRGFVMSYSGAEYVLEQTSLDAWRKLFPEINLESTLPYFAGIFLRGKGRLNFPDCPEAWFRKKLEEDAAKVRRESKRAHKGKSKRGELDAL